MAYEERFVSAPFSGKRDQSIPEDILPLPNFKVVQNFVYTKMGEFTLRRNLSLLTNFYHDELIQFVNYKNQLLVIGKIGIYLYDPSQQTFLKLLKRDNLSIELTPISQKDQDILNPSITVHNHFVYIFYNSSSKILFKKYDLLDKIFIVSEQTLKSNINIQEISSTEIGNNIFVAYVYNDKNISIKLLNQDRNSLDDFYLDENENVTVLPTITETENIVNLIIKGIYAYYELEDGTKKYVNLYSGTVRTGNIVYKDLTDIVIDGDNVISGYDKGIVSIANDSIVKSPTEEHIPSPLSSIDFRNNNVAVEAGNGFILYDFRLWSEFNIENNSYKLIWAPETGMVIINNEGIVASKFNSNFVPLTFDSKMKYTGEPQKFQNEIIIPILQSGQDEFENRIVKRPLNLSIIRISLSDKKVQYDILNDQMLIGGEYLLYYDGEKVTEFGFSERPRLNVIVNANPFEKRSIDIPITTDTQSIEENKKTYTQSKVNDTYLYNENKFEITAGESTSLIGFSTHNSLGSITGGSVGSRLNDDSTTVEEIFFNKTNKQLIVQTSADVNIGAIFIENEAYAFHEKTTYNSKVAYVYYGATNPFVDAKKYKVRIAQISKYKKGTPVIGDYNSDISIQNLSYIDIFDIQETITDAILFDSSIAMSFIDVKNNLLRFGFGQTIDFLEYFKRTSFPLFIKPAKETSGGVTNYIYDSSNGSIIDAIPINDFFDSVISFNIKRIPRFKVECTPHELMMPDLQIATDYRVDIVEDGIIREQFKRLSIISKVPTNNFFKSLYFFVAEKRTNTTIELNDFQTDGEDISVNVNMIQFNNFIFGYRADQRGQLLRTNVEESLLFDSLSSVEFTVTNKGFRKVEIAFDIKQNVTFNQILESLEFPIKFTFTGRTTQEIVFANSIQDLYLFNSSYNFQSRIEESSNNRIIFSFRYRTRDTIPNEWNTIWSNIFGKSHSQIISERGNVFNIRFFTNFGNRKRIPEISNPVITGGNNLDIKVSMRSDGTDTLYAPVDSLMENSNLERGFENNLLFKELELNFTLGYIRLISNQTGWDKLEFHFELADGVSFDNIISSLEFPIIFKLTREDSIFERVLTFANTFEDINFKSTPVAERSTVNGFTPSLSLDRYTGVDGIEKQFVSFNFLNLNNADSNIKNIILNTFGQPSVISDTNSRFNLTTKLNLGHKRVIPQRSALTTNIHINYVGIEILFNLEQQYSSISEFLDAFAPNGKIEFEINSKKITFSNTRDDISLIPRVASLRDQYGFTPYMRFTQNRHTGGPVIIFSFRGVHTEHPNIDPKLREIMLGFFANQLNKNITIKTFADDVEIHPAINSTTELCEITPVTDDESFLVSLKLMTKQTYGDLTAFLFAINPNNLRFNLKLNGRVLDFIESFKEIILNGQEVEIKYQLSTSEMTNNIKSEIDSILPVDDSGLAIDLRVGEKDILLSDSISSANRNGNFGGEVDIEVDKFIKLESIQIFTSNQNNVNKILKVELHSFILKTDVTSLAEATKKFDSFITKMELYQTFAGITYELILSIFDDNFVTTSITEPAGAGQFKKVYTWEGDISLPYFLGEFNFRPISTRIVIRNQNKIDISYPITKSVIEVQFSKSAGNTFSKDDVDPRFVLVNKEKERYPIYLNKIIDVSNKSFQRAEGQALSYPYKVSEPIELNLLWYTLKAGSTDTGEVQTLDNLENRRSYIYSAIFKWIDSRGFEHRSVQALQKDILTSQDIGMDNPIVLRFKNLNLTKKNDVSIEIYRTQKNTVVLRKVSEILNKRETFENIFTDTIEDRLLGEVLSTDTVSLDGCSTIQVYNDRFFLAGFHNFENRVQFSNLLNLGGNNSIKFEDGNSILAEEKVISLNKMDSRLFIFTTDQIYVWFEGISNGIPHPIEGTHNISLINKESIQSTPNGIIFQSKLGFYMINRGLSLVFVGDPIKDITLNTIVIGSSINKLNQEIIFLTDKNTTIIYNYYYNKWSTFTSGGQDLILHEDFVYLADNRKNIWKETSESKKLYTAKLETGWIHLETIKNYQKIKSIFLIGKFKNLKKLDVFMSYDYEDFIRQSLRVNLGQLNNPIPKTLNSAGFLKKGYGLPDFYYGKSDIDDTRQFRFMLNRQKCSNIKLKLELEAENVELSALRFQLRLLPGTGRVDASKQFGGTVQ